MKMNSRLSGETAPACARVCVHYLLTLKSVMTQKKSAGYSLMEVNVSHYRCSFTGGRRLLLAIFKSKGRCDASPEDTHQRWGGEIQQRLNEYQQKLHFWTLVQALFPSWFPYIEPSQSKGAPMKAQ